MKRLIIIFLAVTFLFSLTACNSSSPPVETDSSSNIEELPKSNSMEVDGNITDKVMTEIKSDGITEKLISIGLTEEEATEGGRILRQCGVPAIDICEPTDTNATVDGLVAYRGKLDDDRIFWFTIENRKMFYVALNGEDLYDEDKGGFLKHLDDVHIPETDMPQNQKSEMLDLSESVLDNYFKYAPYYDAWGFARQDNNYMVQCEAYAKNDFGAKDWVRAKVWYEKSNDTYNVTGVEIDGTQYEVK